MDYSQISAIAAAVAAAKQLGEAALGIRDFNQLSGTVMNLNAQLIKAQEGLLAHNAELLQLQNEHFQTCEKLRKLEESVRDRGRYTLVEVSAHQFAYRVNVAPQQGGASEPGASEPPHYLCQSCFDNGRKVVLQGHAAPVRVDGAIRRTPTWLCPVCNRQITR